MDPQPPRTPPERKLDALRRLEQDVERDRDPADPRALQLRLTPRGLEVVTTAIRLVRELDEQHLAPLGGPASPRSAELPATPRLLLGDTQKHEDTAAHE